MADFEIPCETFLRLNSILELRHPDMTAWSNSIRIENGVAISSNLRLIIGEKVKKTAGVVHIVPYPEILAQCRAEAPYNGVLQIDYNEMLNFASVRTAMGYQFPGNAAVQCLLPNELSRWKSVIPDKPAAEPKGYMFWNCDMIAALAKSSPSGCIVFEQFISILQPSFVRDINDPNWFGIVKVFTNHEAYKPATRPGWL